MGAVTFDTLEALNRIPVASETAASIVSGYKRWTVVEGPFKIEYNYYQPANGDALTNGDSFKSGLAHPLFAEIAPVNHNLDNITAGYSCTIEGDESVSTFKTVTCHDVEGAANNEGILVKVYGY